MAIRTRTTKKHFEHKPSETGRQPFLHNSSPSGQVLTKNFATLVSACLLERCMTERDEEWQNTALKNRFRYRAPESVEMLTMWMPSKQHSGQRKHLRL